MNIDEKLFLSDKTNKSGFWALTDISAYHGYKEDPITGKSSWDEVIFEHEKNIVTISGVQFAMENMFGISGPINIPTLKSDIGAGPDNVSYTSSTFQAPSGQLTAPYPTGYRICLFGIGIAGTSENNVTKYPVNYREKSIQISKTAEDGTNLNGIMLPFRYTKTALNAGDQRKYFGKKSENGFTGYYLKTFDTEPTIKHVWDATSTADESDIQQDHVWDLSKKSPVSSYVQIRLKISENDIKEWYSATGNVADAKFNTIGLFTGSYNPSKGDYENVKLFSKLHIGTESLSLSKDVDLLYKVYGA